MDFSIFGLADPAVEPLGAQSWKIATKVLAKYVGLYSLIAKSAARYVGLYSLNAKSAAKYVGL